MDYKSGLDKLRNLVGNSNAEEFLVYENRLNENLSKTNLYGDSEILRSERSQIVHQLNKFSIARFGVSFNDLCTRSDLPKGYLENARENQQVKLFYSYSHKDKKMQERLEIHLGNLKRQGKLLTWVDKNIAAGREWENEIDRNLKSAQIILFLVSTHFINSNYCNNIEVRLAMEMHEKKLARVIPIILRPVDWSSTPFSKLQALPENGEPISSRKWYNQDEAFLNVIRGISKVIDELLSKT
jgi:hypothetical protein